MSFKPIVFASTAGMGILVFAVADCGTVVDHDDILAASSQAYSSYICACRALKNPSSGVMARIFAGGDSTMDNLVVEDAVTHEAYLYLNPGWQRIGSSAKSYTVRTNV